MTAAEQERRLANERDCLRANFAWIVALRRERRMRLASRLRQERTARYQASIPPRVFYEEPVVITKEMTRKAQLKRARDKRNKRLQIARTTAPCGHVLPPPETQPGYRYCPECRRQHGAKAGRSNATKNSQKTRETHAAY